MILLAITITLPWWCWAILLVGLPTCGAFFAWNNTKDSLKKKASEEAQKATDKISGKN
jgi:hypothetical protein